MSEKGSAAAVSALTAKAKLAGMWRENMDQHNTGAVYERIERVIVERNEPADGGVSTSETRFRPSPKRRSLLAQLSAPRDAQRGDSWSFCFPPAQPTTAGSQLLPTLHWGRPQAKAQYQPAPQSSGL